MQNAWKKIKSEIVHKNPWYQIRKDDILRSDGTKGTHFVVDTSHSVYVIAEDKSGKLYMVGQSRYAVDDYVLEFVSGGLKGGKPIDVAKKELLEEAGIIAKKWIPLGLAYPLTGILSEKMHMFLARDLKKTKQQLEETEDITVKKFSVEKIKTMIENGEIIDGQTIATFYKYLLFKNKEKKNK